MKDEVRVDRSEKGKPAGEAAAEEPVTGGSGAARSGARAVSSILEAPPPAYLGGLGLGIGLAALLLLGPLGPLAV
jgi:hypothetical protein